MELPAYPHFIVQTVKSKRIEASGELCRKINQSLEIYEINDRFRRSMEIGDIVLVCVDKIDTRCLIWEAVKDGVSLFVDGRMSAEVLRVLTASDICK